jgi:D-glycero-D-manno-heptose 1,7-bisphosphate phosphatase
MKRRAVFLDRDGVINRYYFDNEQGVLATPFSPRKFKLLPKVGEAIARLNRLGYAAVVASNQPGVAKGQFNLKNLKQMDRKLHLQLNKTGAKLDRIYYCLHHPREGKLPYRKSCSCRKPKAGLLLQAAGDLKINLRKSYMVGDSVTDIEAGKKAGCKTVLIHKYKCDVCQFLQERKVKPDFIAENLYQAVQIISKQEGNNGIIHRHRRR